jgi:hypothetical protein
MTNLQGGVLLEISQPGGSTIYVKSNALSSMSVTNFKDGGKLVTVYAKASIYSDGQSIAGNVSLRMDFTQDSDGNNQKIAFTVLSTKQTRSDGLYYSNDWYYDTVTKSWKSRLQAFDNSTMVFA